MRRRLAQPDGCDASLTRLIERIRCAELVTRSVLTHAAADPEFPERLPRRVELDGCAAPRRRTERRARLADPPVRRPLGGAAAGGVRDSG